MHEGFQEVLGIAEWKYKVSDFNFFPLPTISLKLIYYRIWRQARRNHYPGLPIELPLDFDEYELFDMTTGKKCDYCDTKKKVRPYYIWGVRCCQV